MSGARAPTPQVLANLVADGRLVEIRGTTQVMMRIPGNPVEQTYTVTSVTDLTDGRGVTLTRARSLGVYDNNSIAIHPPHGTAPKQQ
jgi:hypothetical protein